MSTAILSNDGQLTLPREIRERVGLRTGDHVNVTVTGDGKILLEPKKVDILSLEGFLAADAKGKRASLEEIEAAIEDGWVGTRR